MRVMIARRIVPFAVAAVALAGCRAAVTSGEGHQPKDAVPDTRYDALVFMCTAPILGTDPCAAAATDAEIAAVRAELVADPAVAAIAYMSQEQAIELFKIDEPDKAPLVQLGDLPASFMVTFAESVDLASLVHYESEPGVDTVVSCSGRVLCFVSELRMVGVVP
jgi:hypothetical protein